MSLSPHQHELQPFSFRNAPSLGVLPETSQPNSGSSSSSSTSLDVQPGGTTPRHLHCFPAVSGFLLSFWIPSAVWAVYHSLHRRWVSLWGLCSFSPLEKGAPSHASTHRQQGLHGDVPEGTWVLALVCQSADNPSVHPCALDHEQGQRERLCCAWLHVGLSQAAPPCSCTLHGETAAFPPQLEPPPSCSAQLSRVMFHRAGPALWVEGED